MAKDESVPVTINKALLRAFFALVFGAVVLLGALSFYQFRQTLQAEIANNLQIGANAVMQRIDAFFFERMENIRIWRHLEVMQDIRVNDVDKRLSVFLSDLKKGHGHVYHLLLCTDRDGRVVAASDPAWIGRMKVPGSVWHRIPGAGPDEPVVLEPLKNDGEATVALRATVPDAFGKGQLGYFYAVLGWEEVWDLLDNAVANSARDALLLDATGRVIAASARLRQRPGIDGLDLKGWYRHSHGRNPEIRAGDLLGYSALLVGGAIAGGYQHYPGFGWRLLMVVPTAVAFAPIWHLLMAMVILLLITLLAAGWFATRLAARIARPIMGLTEFTRRYRKGEQCKPVNTPATLSEISELTRAYTDMIVALEHSREQIVRAGKLAVVGEMAAVMAHEVRTPLGILRSSAQMLERQPDLGERERELTGFIISETDRLNRLVGMLLECASPRAPDFKPHDIHAIAGHVLDLLTSRAEGRGVRLQRELRAQHSILVCDREQLIQVFLNLVINALHFVPAGGRIVIATRNDGGSIAVSVSDDGPGLPAELRQRVFDPFFTRREGGIGLGLTIVQQIVQVHHGEIRMTESPWGGACFNIRFDGYDEGNGR
jgi:signal transduction histidine kinase